LYERKELLKPEEEKSWKTQEGMLKYGESGSEDEADPYPDPMMRRMTRKKKKRRLRFC
jgi:hypothetical protein